MTEIDLVAPRQQLTVTFALEPAHNALGSLVTLNSGLSGHNEWVQGTASRLSPEQLETNKQVYNAAAAYLAGGPWPTFLAWVDDLGRRDPYAMRDQVLDTLLRKAVDVLGDDPDALPDRATLLADRAAYMSIVERLAESKNEPCDEECQRGEHAMLQDPVARQRTIVTHLRTMWEQHLADEWERNLPMLRESIAAFESIDYSGKSVTEVVSQVTDRDLPPCWETWQEGTEELIFVPSAHMGPYILLTDRTESAAWIVFGARIPEGATLRSAALTRSELAMRLSALADDTRLRILALVAREGEQRAQDVMTELAISQSATSRHLRQLSATGYLLERRCEGAKCYRLNRNRVKDTMSALESYLQ